MQRPPVHLVLAVFAVALTGCFPDGRTLSAEEHLEATRLRLAYEDTFDKKLDPAAIDCLHTVEIYISTEERDRWCDAYACYWVDAFLPRRRGIMLFPDDLRTMSQPLHGQLLRHELLHRLLACAEGNADPPHSHPAWAGAPYVPAPAASIVSTAGAFAPTTERAPEDRVAKDGDIDTELLVGDVLDVPIEEASF